MRALAPSEDRRERLVALTLMREELLGALSKVASEHQEEIADAHRTTL
jgi:hypothetical protein